MDRRTKSQLREELKHAREEITFLTERVRDLRQADERNKEEQRAARLRGDVGRLQIDRLIEVVWRLSGPK